jgi:hypothetical protein
MVYAMMLAAVATLSACNFSFSTAGIKDVQMGKSVNDKMEVSDVTTTFDGTEKEIHCVVHLSNAPSNTKVKAEWVAVNAEGEKPNNKFAETTVEAGGGKNAVDFHLTPPGNGLPSGDYRIDIYLNPDPAKPGPPARTMNFTVKAPRLEITSAVMSSEEDGKAPTSFFPAGTDKIYCYVKLLGARDGATVTASWVAVNVGSETNAEIKRVPLTLKGNQNIAEFYLTYSGGFPSGSYRVDLYLGGAAKADRSLEFGVE